ncbi:MAG: hypothetical protein HAW59_02885 [Betaproteobacteria bacterium]|nr:hypothetical protein [Betaproteobacteria bacterium]
MVKTNQTKQVFVAYPYTLYEKKPYRRVFERAGAEYGVTFFFADERITNMHILGKIRREIEIADFSIFDISGWNANVALELGMAYALPYVSWYICYNPSKNARRDVPADIRGIDRIQYDDFAELERKLIVLLNQNYPRLQEESLQDHETQMRGRVVSLLREAEGGLPIKEIAELLKCSQGMASVLINGLMESGEVESAGVLPCHQRPLFC